MAAIYLDNSSTTPLLPPVWQAMAPYFCQTPGNPASAHAAGRQARQALEDAREQLAALLDARPDEVIFTSGATEANNLALFGLTSRERKRPESPPSPGHIVVSPIEHPSVAEPVRRLGELGFRVDRLPVDSVGLIGPESLEQLLQPDTCLLAIQLTNHETGVTQPIPKLARQLGGRTAFHCDAVQAVGKVPVRFRELGVTSLSLSGHKFHGPKGIGALLVRRGTPLQPLLWGGHQQQGRRPGTEPVALIVGLAKALELACQEMAARCARVLRLRRLLLEGLTNAAAPVVLNGPTESEPGFAVPHTLNISVPGCPAEPLMMKLDLAGIACSTGSACSSGSLLPSPVLQAMQVEEVRLRSAMRFSLSHLLAEADIEEAVRRIALCCNQLRNTLE